MQYGQNGPKTKDWRIVMDDVIKFLRQKDFAYIRDLGRGATGKALLLRDDMLGMYFACKKYSPIKGLEPDEYYQRFLNEIKIMMRVTNRNVVRVYNSYLYPSQRIGFVLMEYIEGKPIFEYLAQNPDLLGDVFVQTISGFLGLEDNGILHRDIRESNILVDNDGTVKIIDFGFGKEIKIDDDFDKSVSLNWWCEVPNEFSERRYDHSTEVYFVGKLFEKAIALNAISGFPYAKELKQMIDKDPLNRVKNFRDVYSAVLSKREIEDLFDESETGVYRRFADELVTIFAKISNSAKTTFDPEQVMSGLDEIYRKNMLEATVQETSALARVFVSGAFTYFAKRDVYVYSLKEFMQLLRGASPDKRRIIMLNIGNRLAAIEHYNESNNFTDDIPF